MGQKIGPTKSLAFHPYKVQFILFMLSWQLCTSLYSYGWQQVELMDLSQSIQVKGKNSISSFVINFCLFSYIVYYIKFCLNCF